MFILDVFLKFSFLKLLFSGKNSTLPVNSLFDLTDLSPMLMPSLYFTGKDGYKDVASLGGVVQATSRCHHSLAYANYNVKVLVQNATIVRSGSNVLPDSIESADDFATALTQAVSDSYARTGNHAESGIALGGIVHDIESKMKRYQSALKGMYFTIFIAIYTNDDRYFIVLIKICTS